MGYKALWRPLHEMNKALNPFWWSARPGLTGSRAALSRSRTTTWSARRD